MTPTRFLVQVFLLMACLHAIGEDRRVDFNRDIRPILSDRCFKCHGPDAENQKSEFRLDSFAHATADLGEYQGIVPGDVKAGELHWRIWEEDPDEKMPPEKSSLFLSDAEKKLLDQWVKEGANYDEHWSFKPIAEPEPVAISKEDERWVKNRIDRFIVDRLSKEGLKPSPEATRSQLLRRASFDLTGLPPTLEETNAFLADDSADAWERVVDRLLASPHYGERMALVWLDAARYADTGGYQNDIRRSQWPWRDWVIDAYNRNMPFDQFTIEQLAGDLLPDPTDSQRLATAFNRNHRINNEGGIIPDEYLVEYVADRAETTSTVWLGLTIACARCHDHKYDPLSQKDFYELYAFFNNIPENGRDGNIAPPPNMPVYTNGDREEHERRQALARMSSEELTAYPVEQVGKLTRWLEEQSAARADSVASITNIPMAALHFTFDRFGKKFEDIRNPKRKGVAGGRRNKALTFKPMTTYGNGITFGQSGYVKIPNAHGSEFDSSQPGSWLLQVHTPARFFGGEGPLLVVAENRTQRGYRIMLEEKGEDFSTMEGFEQLSKKERNAFIKRAQPNRFRISFQLMADVRNQVGIEVASDTILDSNSPARIGVSWDGSGTASGVELYLNGERLETRVLLDQLDAAVTTSTPLLVGARSEKDAKETLRDATFGDGVIDDVQFYETALTAAQMKRLAAANPLDLLFADLTDVARKNLEPYWLEQDPDAIKLTERVRKDAASLNSYEKKAITRVSIMQEQPGLRKTYLLDRGVYDQPDTSEVLQPSPPDILFPMDDAMPKDRLGLAQWIVDPKNPLTARVAVNRYWQMVFGTGLVKTSEDFGSQGELPSHPALLDWLAGEFIRSGWDIKAMQKRIMMSATYRQSSRVTPDLLERDPENRLLARGPRFRLNGQALRDQALAVSGLLVPAIGGRPVMPYQPRGLWDELNAKYPYVTGEGDDLYRRSLYTFWRRTIPPPSMMNFDNASREACSVKSTRTNTPLQAMNLLNDPQFVEAARGLAQRMLSEGGETVEEQLTYGHRLVLARDPGSDVLEILAGGYQDYLSTFTSSPERVTELLKVGNSKPDPDLNPIQLAAMTVVANVVLNLDETVTKE